MSNILLVEDLEECQVVVRRSFTNTDIHVQVAPTVQQALALINDPSGTGFDMVILDLGLPDGEGLTVLEEIRTKMGKHIPVFLLTSHAELDSKVTAFNMGADDYLIKPISGIELRARVEMRLKKSNQRENNKNKLVKGDLSLDISFMRASLKNKGRMTALPLTAKEFKILALLMQNEGHAYSRLNLVKSIWGDSVHVLERTVDSHVFGLRKKLGDYAACIECIPHVGYRFVTPTCRDH